MRWTAMSLLVCAVAVGGVQAEDANLNVNTTAIRSLKDSMLVRAAQIARFKDAGQVGEGRDGMLAVRTLEGLGLGDKKTVEDLVAAENADRRALYKEILTANGLTEADAGRVMAQAAQARRSGAAPEHYVQDPQTGGWVKAKDVKP